MKEFPEVMTAEQAAEYMQISVAEVRRLARSGDLPARKLKGWRITKEAVKEYLTRKGEDRA